MHHCGEEPATADHVDGMDYRIVDCQAIPKTDPWPGRNRPFQWQKPRKAAKTKKSPILEFFCC